MNDEAIVKKMIDFIENKEKEMQAEKTIEESKVKSDVVSSILAELDVEVKDED